MAVTKRMISQNVESSELLLIIW